jgi:hypothetical protein
MGLVEWDYRRRLAYLKGIVTGPEEEPLGGKNQASNTAARPAVAKVTTSTGMSSKLLDTQGL